MGRKSPAKAPLQNRQGGAPLAWKVRFLRRVVPENARSCDLARRPRGCPIRRYGPDTGHYLPKAALNPLAGTLAGSSWEDSGERFAGAGHEAYGCTVSVLFTPRMVLRQWRASDLAPFAALNADAEVRRHFPGGAESARARSRSPPPLHRRLTSPGASPADIGGKGTPARRHEPFWATVSSASVATRSLPSAPLATSGRPA
jgi:hypothetical protein